MSKFNMENLITALENNKNESIIETNKTDIRTSNIKCS